ncbi:STAS domain-containing protein [Rhodoflexus caldus]|uniref:STAS domain-containing protein n=1 Tax=Rhodoflexus caldus TaxID=2891236 RepID=UPI00202A0D78|nr:STAS domain-containing protein [Rhodoflexus caldus]
MDNFFAQVTDNQILTIEIKGDLLGQENEADIIRYVEQQLPQHVVFVAVDISQVPYMNSSGLTILIRLLTRFRNRNGDLVLIQPSESVKKLLLITKLNQIFHIFDTKEAAVAYLAGLQGSVKQKAS